MTSNVEIQVAVRRRFGWRAALCVLAMACRLGLAKPETAARVMRRRFIEIKVGS